MEVVARDDDEPKHPVRRRIYRAGRKDGRRVRLAARKEPTEWQEGHSPTDAVMIRLTGQKKTTLARRRKTDARLWDAMSGFQQEAALAIADAFEAITAGTAAKVQKFERSGQAGYRPPSVAQIEAAEDYWRWAKRVQAQGLSHAAVVDILIMGESCSKVDKARRKREGWAKVNLLEALNLYCEQQGWPQNPIDHRAELRY